jgi:Predicted transcriptional regulator containing an HTH domain and an uncharacterized domain shared with the mammalian protein Schlafen
VLSLQELITRARFVMGAAPSRLAVFQAVDGRRTARDIAASLSRHVNNVRRDLTMLRDAGLIQSRVQGGVEVVRDGFAVFEKVPLARTVPTKYFGPVGARPPVTQVAEDRQPRRRPGKKDLPVPDENQVLEIARSGETQLYEFKAPGVDVGKISREICAMLNTLNGGIIFYGIDDNGVILGTDITRQQLDQPLQNSVKNTISPAATVQIRSVSVLGAEILMVLVPPWNRRDVYQYSERILIRKGTNVFAAKPEEIKALHRGEAVV